MIPGLCLYWCPKMDHAISLEPSPHYLLCNDFLTFCCKKSLGETLGSLAPPVFYLLFIFLDTDIIDIGFRCILLCLCLHGHRKKKLGELPWGLLSNIVFLKKICIDKIILILSNLFAAILPKDLCKRHRLHHSLIRAPKCPSYPNFLSWDLQSAKSCISLNLQPQPSHWILTFCA